MTQQKPVRILKINCRKSHQISWNSDGLLKSYNAKYTKEGVCIPLREIQSPFFFCIFRTTRNFLIKFCSSDPSLNINILRSIYLKFKTCAHAQIPITHYYVLFTISGHMNLKLTLGIHFDKWSWAMILSTWSSDFFHKCL